jgi:hypothetical protein
MGILCGLSRTCLSDHNNDLVFSKLGWDISDTWGAGPIALTVTKGGVELTIE